MYLFLLHRSRVVLLQDFVRSSAVETSPAVSSFEIEENSLSLMKRNFSFSTQLSHLIDLHFECGMAACEHIIEAKSC